MRDRGLIVHKHQWSILHALVPSFPQSHNTGPMQKICFHQKQIIPTNQRSFLRCWLDEMEDRRGAVWQVHFPSLLHTPPPPYLNWREALLWGPLSFCPGRQQQSRTVSGFEDPDFYAEADTWTTRDHINWRHVQCTDQSCPKQISPLNSNHRLEVVTDFKREWKDNSRTGKDLLMVMVYFRTLSAS